MNVRFRRFAVVIAALVALSMLLVACGDSKKDNTTATTSTTGGATIAVPADIKSKGTLSVASDASYAPNEFLKSQDVVGMDVDLINAIAAELGLKADTKNVPFDSIIPGLAAKKYDIGISSFTDTKEREATVDFVTYFTAGTSFFVPADGGPTVNTLADLCGLKVAVEKGTVQADDAKAQSKKCTSAGKKAVDVLVFPDQSGANLALSSGRGQVGMADSPVAAYQVKQSAGKFKLSGDSYDSAPYGIAIPKDSGLAKPILAAVKKLIADGKYKEILTQWGVEAGAITDPVINGATS